MTTGVSLMNKLIEEALSDERLKNHILQAFDGPERIQEMAEEYFSTVVALAGNDGVPILVNSRILALFLSSVIALGYKLHELEVASKC